jgi:exopolysaccharide biosynthesis WecB/TagA/CpsF family protein
MNETNINPNITYPQRRVFIIDELALVLAFFTALFIRFCTDVSNWSSMADGLYVSVLVVLILMQGLIFAGYDARRESMFEQGRIQNLVMIIKGRIILLLFVICYLYVIQQGENSSRFVVPATIVFDIGYEFLFRQILRKSYFAKVGVIDKEVFSIRPPFPSDEKLLELFKPYNRENVLIHRNAKAGSEAAGTVATLEELQRVSAAAEKAGAHPYLAIPGPGFEIRSGVVSDINGYASVPMAVRKEHFHIFGIHYAVARVEEAVIHVIRHIDELSGKYICFSNVHTTVMGKEDPEYKAILNGAAFTFADGNPIAVLQQKSGFQLAERVAGPDFMEHMFRATKDGSLSHYFYGSTDATLSALKEKLEKKYPGIDIRGMYSPPFRALSEEEDKADIDMINASGADIVWIGLGAPKQEKWMKAHEGKIKGVMMGVGAGFDFHAGTIKRAPKWVQGVGFEWLYRLFQDPKRLVRRYLVTNIKFMWYLIFNKKKMKK